MKEKDICMECWSDVEEEVLDEQGNVFCSKRCRAAFKVQYQKEMMGILD